MIILGIWVQIIWREEKEGRKEGKKKIMGFAPQLSLHYGFLFSFFGSSFCAAVTTVALVGVAEYVAGTLFNTVCLASASLLKHAARTSTTPSVERITLVSTISLMYSSSFVNSFRSERSSETGSAFSFGNQLVSYFLRQTHL
jgi:hypothetical protein